MCRFGSRTLRSVGGGEENRGEGEGEGKVRKGLKEKDKLLTMALKFGDEIQNKVKQ